MKRDLASPDLRTDSRGGGSTGADAGILRPTAGPAAAARSRPAAVAGWTFVVAGIGHGFGSLMPWPKSARPGVDAMERTTVDVGGVSRSLAQLMNGFSVGMLLLLLSFGAIVLLLLRRGQLPRDIAWVGLALSVTMLAVSVVLLGPPSIGTMGIATVGFGLALRR